MVAKATRPSARKAGGVCTFDVLPPRLPNRSAGAGAGVCELVGLGPDVRSIRLAAAMHGLP